MMINNASIPDAVSALLSITPSLSLEEVPLEDALGRVLAYDLKARLDLPPCSGLRETLQPEISAGISQEKAAASAS